MACGLLCLVWADLKAPWSEVVLVTDACETGFGVCESTWTALQSAEVGGDDERWRFRRMQHGGHRRRALRAAGLGDMWDPGPGPEAWVEDLSFSDVPHSLLDESLWHVRFAAPYTDAEAIHVKEARGTAAAVRHIARCGRSAGRRHLILGDNMSVALAHQKVRCGDHKLLRVCPRVAATCLVGDLQVWLRWVPSELNPGDRS